MYKPLFWLLPFWWCLAAHAQPNFTANNYVMPYDAPFRFGANLGNYPPWSNQQVANIATGNMGLGLEGIGANAYRSGMAEHFLEAWGYNFRLQEYQHLQTLGATDNLAFIGFPSEPHRDPGIYCDTLQSALFANMYLPIWDGGANGTPVNDQNFYALYLWKMVNIYKPYIRFWEIWNEPDFTYNAAVAYAPPGIPGNWWENNPSPCDYAIMAPIFHYVRLLRISWEVIKTVDSTAYVAIGGIGNPAFLDAVLRNTDNPTNGSETADYPLGGGAYFDVLSYHSYPHLDGSMWEFPPTGGLFFHRHSDRGIEGMLARQTNFRQVLETHGYDGITFPEKHWVISETNIPRKPFNVYIGSDEAQRNYVIKALTEARKHGIEQLYLFNVADLEDEEDAWNEFLLMGLFKNLSSYVYPDYELNDAAAALKTTANFFNQKAYNASLTEALNLPDEVNGAAFTGTNDTLFVLWAKTTTDSTEAANTLFSFPAFFQFDSLYKWEWDFSEISDTLLVNAGALALTGSPVFLKRRPATDTVVVNPANERFEMFGLTCFPNPAGGHFTINLKLPEPAKTCLRLLNLNGQVVEEWLTQEELPAGSRELFIKTSLPAGLYWLEADFEGSRKVVKKVVIGR